MTVSLVLHVTSDAAERVPSPGKGLVIVAIVIAAVIWSARR